MQAAVNYCRDRNIPVHVIGRGSNIIVRDGGLRGAVIHPSGGEFDVLEIQGNRLTAGAGVRLKNWFPPPSRTALAAWNGWTAFPAMWEEASA